MTAPHWKELVKQLHAGNCVPFLGAAVNVSSSDYTGLPLAGQVVAKLIHDLTDREIKDVKELAVIQFNPRFKEFFERYPELGRLRASDLSRVAFYTSRERRNISLIELLQKILPDKVRGPSKLLKTLARLPVPLIVTTNYDRLMEKALEKAPLLRPTPVCDLRKEAIRFLRHTDDSLAERIRTLFSPDTEEVLKATGPNGEPSAQLQTLIGRELIRLFDDVRDPRALALKLRNRVDAPSTYLHDKFSNRTRQLLAEYDGAQPPSKRWARH